MFASFLGRFGMSQDDADKGYEALLLFETTLAQTEASKNAITMLAYSSEGYHPSGVADLVAASPNFPIADVLKPFTDAGVSTFNNLEPTWLSTLNELYTSDNLEALKSGLLFNLMVNSVSFLDQSCAELAIAYSSEVQGTDESFDAQSAAFDTCNNLLGWQVGKVYCDAFVKPETKAAIEEMVQEILAFYRVRLQAETWLTQETRDKAVEKLEGIKVHAAYPDDWTPYAATGLTFKSASEGGGLFEDAKDSLRFFRSMKIDSVVNPSPDDLWSFDYCPQTAAAFYDPGHNSINILSGFLVEAFYDENASESTNLGGIGAVIGHEITHAFDSTGGNFDKNGNLVDWWTAEDKQAFQTRTAKVSAYFSTFEPIEGYKVNGDATIGETVADLGSFTCMMEIAKNKTNFDYEEFFTNIARLWRTQETVEIEQDYVTSNNHPPQYLRINASLQQLQEFYDTYGAKEGDNKYLTPADRLSV